MLLRASVITLSVLVLLGSLTQISIAEGVSYIQGQKKSCAIIQSKLKSAGKAIVYYRSKNDPKARLYDKFVGSSASCLPSEGTVTTNIFTIDVVKCALLQCRGESKAAKAQKAPPKPGKD